MSKLKPLIVVFMVLAYLISFGQGEKQSGVTRKLSNAIGNTRLVITGTGWFGYGALLNNKSKTDVTNSFNTYGFSPVVLWKLSKRLFFESEIEIGDDEFELEFAKLSFIVNDYIIIGAGRMLSPFGAYAENWEPKFVERFPNPPGIDDESHLFHGAIMGVDVRGAFPLGPTQLNYVVYVSNGPILDQSTGMIQWENIMDENNNNKAFGGRIGFLPLSNSSLEIGFSLKHGIAGDQGDPVYKNIGVTAWAADLNYVTDIKPLKSTITLRGQFNSQKVDNAYYPLEEGDRANDTIYTFDNKKQVYFAQFSIRPSLVKSKFFKNLEMLVRFNSLTDPKDATWGAKDKNGNGGTIYRTDFGITYWMLWKASLRLAYETTKMPDNSKENAFLAEVVYAF